MNNGVYKKMNNEYSELEIRELWIAPSRNNKQLVAAKWSHKSGDEGNNFNFSAHRKHWNPRETSEIQSGKPRNKTP